MALYDSLHEIPLDALAEKVGGRIRLTYLISQRLCQINAGAPLLVELGEDEALLAAERAGDGQHVPARPDQPRPDRSENR